MWRICDGCGVKPAKFGLASGGATQWWCDSCGKGKVPVDRRNRKMCEGCGLKQPRFGMVVEGKPRWCASCGKPKGAVIISVVGMAERQHQATFNLTQAMNAQRGATAAASRPPAAGSILDLLPPEKWSTWSTRSTTTAAERPRAVVNTRGALHVTALIHHPEPREEAEGGRTAGR